MSKRTLIVREIINLTDNRLATYGTSGQVIELEPVDRARFFESLNERTERDIYYVADKRLTDESYKNHHFVKPIFTGNGRNGEGLYRFVDNNGAAVVPITENTGVAGTIEKEKEYRIPRYRMAMNWKNRYNRYL